jgi:chorismate-pyruvate lyase
MKESFPPMSSSTTNLLAHPLDEFYTAAGLPLPPLNQIDGAAVPEPYRSLLVHQHDMTPTLEKFHGQSIHIQVLGRRRKGDSYYREVVLRLDATAQPVEFGAIKINLALFPTKAREEILQERLPLGHVLHEHKIPHTSRPSAYLRIASDKFINDVLGMAGAHVLYGRRNTLFNPQERPLAEIVEILPVTPLKENDQ